jgi:serine/threonine-protein kinase
MKTDDLPDTWIGRVLGGRYCIERRLGAGGMGVVFLAEDQQLERRVVVKVMRSSGGADPTLARRFSNEARLLARLSHPHVVSLFDFGQEESGELFLAMEALEGQSLHGRLELHGVQSWTWVAQRVREIALALAAAHAHGIAHRDLKPANVFLVDGDGLQDFVKVLDFGLARAARRAPEEESLTGSGELIGTPGYVSPEQVEGGEGDTRSDLYALGVIAYEALTGDNPFRRDTPVKTLTAHLDERPPPPSEAAPHARIPAALDEIIGALLARSPDARTPSALALVSEIDALLHDQLAVDKEPTPTRPLPRQTRPTAMEPPRRWLRWQHAFSLVVIMATAWLVASRPTPAAMPRVDSSAPEISVRPFAPLKPPPPTRPEVLALGQALYETEALSGHGVTCAACHPISGWGTTAEKQTVLGASGKKLPWNTPSVFNAPHSYRQLWKAEVEKLGDVIDRPLFNPNLMNAGDWDSVLKRLRAEPELVSAFRRARLDVDVPSVRLALASYMRTLTPRGSVFDRWLSNKAELDVDQLKGYQLFVGYGCAACHQGRNVGGNMIARFGVMAASPYAGRGVCSDGTYCRGDESCADGERCLFDERGTKPRDPDMGITGDLGEYVFRVPSLRNVAMTAPYFHDGSAADLSTAVRTMANLQLGRHLADDEVKAIVAFLETLTGELPRGTSSGEAL